MNSKKIIVLSILLLPLSAMAATMDDAKNAEKNDNYGVAIPLYKQFAEDGNTQAMRRLAYFAEIGVGGKRDWVVSAQWLVKAFDAGDLSAADDLGFIGRNCKFMNEDCQISPIKPEIERIANEGSAIAQMSLGVILYPVNYDDPTPDYAGKMKEAAVWYRRAAAQGNKDAQISLAIMNQFGLGILQDYVEAHKWYNIAASGIEDKDADIRSDLIQKREILERKMTPTQIQEAQSQAKAWHPSPEH